MRQSHFKIFGKPKATLVHNNFFTQHHLASGMRTLKAIFVVVCWSLFQVLLQMRNICTQKTAKAHLALFDRHMGLNTTNMGA